MVKRNILIKSVTGLTLIILLFSSSLAWSLPAYRRLWERKYKYKMSCALCHTKGGGSELTGYANDFRRFGLTPGAYKTIEKRDSDGDKYINSVEIEARSNPGDPFSTPDKTTDWLEHIEESALPLKLLENLFPGITKFSALEGTILEKHVSIVENKLGIELSEADKIPTFYFAVKKMGEKYKRIGVALFVTPNAGKTKLITSVGINLKGEITGIRLVKNKLDDKLANEVFLNQFIGKSVKDSLTIKGQITPVKGKEEESSLVAFSIRKSLLIIQAVFSRK